MELLVCTELVETHVVIFSPFSSHCQILLQLEITVAVGFTDLKDSRTNKRIPFSSESSTHLPRLWHDKGPNEGPKRCASVTICHNGWIF